MVMEGMKNAAQVAYDKARGIDVQAKYGTPNQYDRTGRRISQLPTTLPPAGK
jgi:hypothetical protein